MSQQSDIGIASLPGLPADVRPEVTGNSRLDAFAQPLLHADSIDAVAAILLVAQRRFGATPQCLAWSTDWPHSVTFHPADYRTAARLDLVERAIAARRDAAPLDRHAHILCDDGGSCVALLLILDPLPDEAPAMADDALLAATGKRLAELLRLRNLHDSVVRLQQGEQLQRALYAIADMAGSELDMPDMLRGLHRIVAELMYAENFYITLYDSLRDTLRFLYFVDSEDDTIPGAEIDEDIPLRQFERGMTWYLVRDGKPLMGTIEQLRKQVSGPLQQHGAVSVDWLGVPMLRDGRVHGAVVVQSYLPGVRFSAADRALLAFVAEHILTALERKRSQEDMERQVQLRTHELAEANIGLREQIAERERGERLQAALYQIAALAGSEETGHQFFVQIHQIISRLLNAENFYIALLSTDGETVEFPYVVDEREPDWSSRPRARGLTEYVLNTRRAQIVSAARAAELAAAGEIDLGYVGAPAEVWLGVPLLAAERAIGVIAVQSYADPNAYTDADAELLGFVATQLASSLQRRREIIERERGEHLQAVLYRIAALASSDESSEFFYRHVHAAVGELLNAENFYIALLSEDGTTIEFPYWIDAYDPVPSPRPLKQGLTEYVMRSGKPQLVDRARASQLIADDEVDYGIAIQNSTTQCWLGVPLIGSDGVMGVIALQSYSDAVNYDARDAELLTFASYQIASSLQRRSSAEALKRLNAELEQRVQDRTAELREQIAVRERVEAQLMHQVMHDALTGLPNRIYLRDRLERAIASLRRDSRKKFGLLYIDIDRFKLVNDSLGHLAGDVVLQEVARRLIGCIREPDVVARLAGDEFAILLEHVEIPETATKIARRILESMLQPIVVAGQPLQAGVSVGIAIGDAHYRSADEPLRDADTALYRAKSGGRSRFVLYDDSLNQAAMDVFALEQGLRRAIAHDEFMPWFQPLVRLHDATVIGYEALLRWQHPQRGVLVPGDFLQVAEDSGLIEPIDWRMFQLAMECGGQLVRDGGFVTINLSPRLFQDEDLDRRLLQLTRDTGFDPTKLRIEVTEGTLLGDVEAAAAVLQRLREAGIETVLDDFGTGYSSLGQVHRFPLKMIKIDRSFISPIGTSASSRTTAVIGAILALSQSLGLEVLAEGIETEEQRDVLLAMGCVYGQGYLFDRPQRVAHWMQLPADS
ncbi:MAG: EAL domain-containing protein [Gammaproteobacteria bacterium]|nr:EAL domain-containing protein [Gammaproteobacteria bacterium]